MQFHKDDIVVRLKATLGCPHPVTLRFLKVIDHSSSLVHCQELSDPQHEVMVHPEVLRLYSRSKPVFSEEYQELIQKVRDLGHPEAADYLENQAWNLGSWVDTPDLNWVFDWCATPQGYAYWDAISDAILESRKQEPVRPEFSEEYQALIQEVRDLWYPDAADYLEYEAWKLRSWIDTSSLACAFDWDETPHGVSYWEALNADLRESRKQEPVRPEFSEEYLRLIQEVRDLWYRDAVDYLTYEAWKLSSWVDTSDLSDSFSWNETPQGYTYWKTIHDAIRGPRRQEPAFPKHKPVFSEEYLRLIQKVRDLGYHDAVDYLENEAWKLGSWVDISSLYCAFDWRETPQGYTYWETIHDAIRGHHEPEPDQPTPKVGDIVRIIGTSTYAVVLGVTTSSTVIECITFSFPLEHEGISGTRIGLNIIAFSEVEPTGQNIRPA